MPVQLEGVREHLSGLPVEMFESMVELEASIKSYIEGKGLQNGNVLWPLRVSLSGQERSASPFELLWALGKEESIARIDRAVSLLV